MSKALMATFAVLLFQAVPSLAIDCHATGGYPEDPPVWPFRHVSYDGKQMVLTGDFGGRFVLTCAPLQRGIFCQGKAGNLDIVIVANGNRMTESIADSANGREYRAYTYFCDGPVGDAR